MRLIIFSLLSLLFSVNPLFAQTTTIQNAGFVQGIWYAHHEPLAGVPTRIYVAIRNNTPHDLAGTIRFTDNGKRIGSMEVRALSGRLVEAWSDWTPTDGDHIIAASLENTTLYAVDGTAYDLTSTNIIANDARFVDRDTDHDTIPNQIDEDDDNDGISDTREHERGTDPLVPQPIPSTEKTDGLPLKKATEENPEKVRAGIEQFLPESPAEQALSSLTNVIANAEDAVNTYRDARKIDTDTPNIAITPETDNASTSPSGITRTQTETSPSWGTRTISFLSTAVSLIWDIILGIVSIVLAHPALVQIILLVGTLYILFMFARKLGRRTFK